MEYTVGPSDGLMLSILVLFLGSFLTKRIRILQEYNIPTAVTGGLICSTVIGVLFWCGGPQISFDMEVRDNLLLVFFTTIGLSAKVSVLKSGGKALAVLVAVAAVFLVLQDVTGVLLVMLVGEHAGLNGLFQRFGVHIAVHQHFAAIGIGGNHRQQPVFVEFGRQFVVFLDLLDRLAGGEKA